jgi:Holliday junction resolvasome RuvABC DNA-binding subunit
MSDMTIYNAETGETTSRKYTKAEKDFVASLSIHGQDQIDAANQLEDEKLAEKENAIQALTNLGLTEAQAKAIAGI